LGGFLGIGKSSEEKQLESQAALNAAEIEKSRKDAEIRLAERSAKKGKETAKIKLGQDSLEFDTAKEDNKTKSIGPSPSLGIGGIKKQGTGVQL
jgi:hypothetical protein